MQEQQFWDTIEAYGLACDPRIYSRLNLYAEQLSRHNRHTNLVSASTIKDLWLRHFFDCLQLSLHIKDKNAIIVDLGCGAGLPGLVLAMAGYQNTYLIEANRRKCVFAKICATALNIQTTIVNSRIENTNCQQNPVLSLKQLDFITARACAPLEKLLQWSYPYFKPNTEALFFKGKNHQQEWLSAQKTPISQNFDKKSHPSLTNPQSVLLSVKLKSAKQI